MLDYEAAMQVNSITMKVQRLKYRFYFRSAYDTREYIAAAAAAAEGEDVFGCADGDTSRKCSV